MNVSRDGDAVRVEAPAYVLSLGSERPFVELTRPRDGRRVARLNPIGAVDAIGALDATVSIGEARVAERSGEVWLELPVVSTAWRSKRAVVRCADDEVGLSVEVEAGGDVGGAANPRLSEVRLLGGWYPTDRRWPAAWYRSSIAARSIVPAAPADPSRIVLDPAEGVRLAVS
ncbi:MAG TPA: hypothetical protein VFS32_11960, partial [Candidatus Limnocylindrales bacterium]|nr:hypothetical protein [Candidatus Limnocylindrales bacterium]